MNLSEIKAFIVFLFSKKKIIFFTCSSLFIFTLLFNLLIPQNYRGEITIHKFNDIAIEEYANQNNKFFGFLYNFNSKYNVTYNSKNRLINYNQLENRYLYNEDYFLNFIRNNIDSELIKEGIFYSKIHENSSENEIDQKVLEYIKKIKINSSKEFLTGFIRSEKNYIYLTFKYSDSEKIKIFLDYLISESIKDLKKEYFDNRKLELIKIIQDNLEKQQITIQENLEKKQIKVQENLEKQRNTNVLNVVDAGFSNLHINQKITREIYNLEIKECVSEIQNLIKRISFIDKNANYDVTVKIYNFKIDLNNAKKFLQDLLKTAKKVDNCNILVEPYIDDISGEQYINHEFAKIKSLFEKENLDFFKNSYQEYEDKYLYDVDLVNYKKSNINIAKIEKFTIEKSLFILFFSFFTFILYFLFAFLAKSKK